MSTTIDQRVVEMRFDNQHFEKNVQTSMSTLEKLKQSLNLTGASKGLESINAAAKNNNMGALGASVEQVQAKFSALQVMGVTALANITNSAVNAGKRMVSALTIDPIKTGLQEYETQINAVQTILANTQSKGTNIDDVNAALEELNKYADKTIYNFTEMTRNIGTFTAAGVDLDTSVSAIQGIANLAAVSGSTSQQASTAMYQLSQALATGTVKLQDWNSVVNAGMGGEVFQNALVRTAAVMSGASDNVEAWRKENIDAYGSFRDSLTQGEWLTTEVLTETLNQFTMATEGNKEKWEEYKKSLMDTGYTEKQAEEILKMADTATEAATKVKTFTQLWDVLKESAQSGWSQTWKIIIGDFEEAKSLFSPLADFLTGVINKMSDARNNLLEGALGKSFTGLVDKVKSVTKPIEKSADAVKNVVKSVEKYETVVDDIIGGKWGNGQERWDKLAKEGYDWAHAQNLVNEKLGDGTRHATNYKEAQEEVAKSQKKSNEQQDVSVKATARSIEMLCSLSDEQLKAKGFTDEQIEAFRELAEVADKTGIPLREFIENIDEIDGRYLLINALKNAASGLVGIFKAVGQAWRDTFDPITADQLFNVIAGFHKFTLSLRLTDAKTGELTETGDKLVRTFKGVFAILGMVSDVLGGGFKIAFKLVSAILKHFDLNILDVTAAIGDALVKFREATDISKLFGKALDAMVPILSSAADTIGDWVDSFLELPAVQKAIGKVKDIIADLKDMDLKEIGQNIVDGLVNGLGDGAEKAVQAIIDLGIKILEGIKGILGIHSPSTEFFEIGKNIIDGLVNGLQNGISKVGEFFKTLGTKCMEFISNIDWGSVYAAAVSVGVVAMLKKLMDILDAFSSPFGGLGDIFENTAEVIKKSTKNVAKVIGGFAKVLKAHAFEKTAGGIKQLAIAIAILAGSIYILTTVDDPKKLWNAVGVIAAMAAILGGLAFAVNKMSDSAVSISKGGLKIGGMKLALVAIGASLMLLASTVKILGNLDPETAKQGFIRLAGCIVALGAVLAAYGKLVKGKSAQNIDKLGKMMIKLSVALLLMVGAVKLIGMLSDDEMVNGAKFAAAFVVFVAALTGVTQLAGKKIDKIGGMVLKISIAMALMVGVIKLVNLLNEDEMKKGAAFAIAFTIFVAALVGITKKGKDQDIHKIGGLLLAISGAMAIMTGVIKVIGSMTPKEMIKGGIAIAAFTGIIYLLVKMVKTIEKDVPKVAGTLIAMSVAIGILAGVSILMSLMSIGGLAKGIVAVGLLGAILSMMIKATKGASDVKGSIIAMAIAIGVMAAAVAALSLIPFEKLGPAVLALGTLMGMFALIAKAASNMGKVMGSLIVMTVMIGVLAVVIWKLSELPMDRALGAAGSLSLLMLSMAASMTIMGMVKTVSASALIAMGVLTLIIGLLAQILVKMGEMNPESAMGNVKALSVLLLALSGACVVLGLVGLMGPAAFVGVAALATLIVGLGAVIVAIGALADKFPKLEEFLNKGLPILEKIGYGIGSFFGNIIGGFTDGVTAGLPDMATNLSNFMTNLQPFVDGAKGIDEAAFTGIKNLVKMLALIAGANVLEAISSFISGQSSMETFATQMAAFGDAIVTFSNKVSGSIDEEAVLAAANAGKMLAEMQNMVSANGGVFQFFTGEKNLETFGTQLLAFGDAIVAFSNKVSGSINEEAVTAAANAGTLMAEMQSKIVPSGGVVQWFTGEKDMETFATQLSAFGKAISSFSQAVAGGISEEAVMAAANAGSLMAEMQAKIVPAGGVVQWFTGEKDMATFGTQLVAFGTAIVAFSNKVSEGVDETAVTAASTAGSIMTELQSKIVPTGGVVQWFTGEQNLSTFGAQLVLFGQAMVAFSETVSGNVNEEAITAAANAGKVMVTLQKSIPEDKWLDGKVSLDDFGKTIKKFGEHIKKYSEEVSGIDSGSIDTSVAATKQIVSITKSLKSVDPENIDNFKAKKLGTAIKEYSDKVSGISTGDINNSISAIGRLKNLIVGMAGMDTSGVSSFKKAVSSLASTNMDGVVDSFASAASKLVGVGANIVTSITNGMRSKQGLMNSTGAALVSNLQKQVTSKSATFQKAGVDTMSRFAAGLKSSSSKVTSAIKTPIMSGVTAARGYYTSFYNAGSYLVTGFANGISANSFRAAAKARAMANAAEKAAKDALDINSPSKVFYKIGSYVVDGFTNSLRDNTRSVYNSTFDMANGAVKGFSKAIGTVNELLSGDMDAQPTIRPVLDLSEVSAGAKTVNGMFSMQPSIGVMSNLGAVSSLVNSNNQNGSNAEVISAIDRLRKSMGNLGSTTYNVNGITYDDGSNVSNAVKDIIRHTRIEGRV